VCFLTLTLSETGIQFPNKEALELFKHHGFKIEGEKVFFNQQDIEKALETIPERFELHARNEDNSFVIGDDSYRMAPGYGPPFIIEKSGEMRHAVLDDTTVNLSRRPKLWILTVPLWCSQMMCRHKQPILICCWQQYCLRINL